MTVSNPTSANQKALQIINTLGKIYAARGMIPVTSVQVAGVSYDNLGEAGLHWLSEMADGGGYAQVLATLNPAGMDIENWQALGIPADFAEKQRQVIDAFARMGIVTTCTCTPYLSGNLPHFGEHIAWAESSAVCYANSVIGARTNREGGPSALAAALTGVTPEYGLHLADNRKPGVTVLVKATPTGTADFGALGKVIGEKLEVANQEFTQGRKLVPYIQGIEKVTLEELKSFCASVATYGGVALFHMQGVTPEAVYHQPPAECFTITQGELQLARDSLCDASSEDVDFCSLGCPHLSIREVARIASLLRGRKVTKEFWITTSRPIKLIADQMGYSMIIEASGAKFAVDTCCVVAPIKGRFHAMATDSGKACYYAYAKNNFKTRLLSFDDVVWEAMK